MKTNLNLSRRIGKALGKAWRGWLRLESHVASWLEKIRLPATLTKIVLRLLLAAGIVKLIYVSGLLTLLGAFLAVAALIVVSAYVLANWAPTKDETPTDEWDYGPQGYGLYSKNGFRIDDGDEEH
jgi:hypothetical protein